MDKAVILGAGTYGQVYAEYISEQGNYEIAGYLDDDEQKIGKFYNGLKVLGPVGDFQVLEGLNIKAVFAPIGNNKVRVALLEKAQTAGYDTPCFIHESAVIHSTVKIGKAVYVLPSSSIMPLTMLGDYVMVSMGVNIAHHTSLDFGCFCAHGSNVGASMNLKAQVFVGIAATIMTGVKRVGKNATIGAGALVNKDVEDNAVMVGNPAKLLKYNSNG
jgi:sugar O-acyltransferase (sialic acid O-acetyltransferase NeuD family)